MGAAAAAKRLRARARAQVAVLAHKRLQHAVWLGASLLARSPSFPACCVSRGEYAEAGYARQSKATLWDVAGAC